MRGSSEYPIIYDYIVDLGPIFCFVGYCPVYSIDLCTNVCRIATVCLMGSHLPMFGGILVKTPPLAASTTSRAADALAVPGGVQQL